MTSPEQSVVDIWKWKEAKKPVNLQYAFVSSLLKQPHKIACGSKIMHSGHSSKLGSL